MSRNFFEEFRTGTKDNGYTVKCIDCLHRFKCNQVSKASEECTWPSYESYIDQDKEESESKIKLTVKLEDTELFRSVLDVMEFLLSNASDDIREQAIDKMCEVGILKLYNNREA